MLKIGLTGGIGSGKSTAASFFRSQGIDVIDLDQLARDVVAPGTRGLEEIRNHYSDDILLNDGNLDRKKLGDIIFAEPAEKAWLESLLHPLINRAKEAAVANSQSAYLMIEIPLLVENQLQNDVDRVLVIYCDTERQIERASLRGQQTEQQIRKIIDLQATNAQRQQIADDSIENNGTEQDLMKKLSGLHQDYLHLAQKSEAD